MKNKLSEILTYQDNDQNLILTAGILLSAVLIVLGIYGSFKFTPGLILLVLSPIPMLSCFCYVKNLRKTLMISAGSVLILLVLAAIGVTTSSGMMGAIVLFVILPLALITPTVIMISGIVIWKIKDIRMKS